MHHIKHIIHVQQNPRLQIQTIEINIVAQHKKFTQDYSQNAMKK